jgi:hypothetical protein
MRYVRTYMITPERIEAAFNHVEWLRAALHDKEISAAPTIRAAVACLGIAQDHHHSIVLLIDHKLNASAYALIRVALESYVRGMWLALCASDEQVAKFWAGDNPPVIDALLKQLESTPSFSEGVLSQIKREHWGALCGFTHTGGLQVQRWNTEISIEPSYEPNEVAQVLFFAELIGSLAVIGVAEVSHDDELAQRVLAQIKALPIVV